MNDNEQISPDDIEQQQIDEVPDADSKLLAVHVVVYRGLGIKKDLAIACMSELAKRRSDGEEFDYESFIEQESAKIQQPQNMDMVKITKDIQKQVKGMGRGTSLTKINRS